MSVTLGAWESYLGKSFSGSATYETAFDCAHPAQIGACVIEIGEVQYTCEVKVNGEVCTMRGKKVRGGDEVAVGDVLLKITAK